MRYVGTVLCLILLWTIKANADEHEEPWSQQHAFDRDFAIGLYATGWAGHYFAGGLGGRLRWEMFDRLGVEVYSEHALVRAKGGVEHDHPVGFNLYTPFRLNEFLRLRPLLGFCAVFRFFHPDQDGVERIDDILFGVHAGGGIEVGLGRWASLFIDAQAGLYFGHDRYHGGWMTHVGDEITQWLTLQATLGVQVHL